MVDDKNKIETVKGVSASVFFTRKCSGLGVRKLARDSGVSPGTISMIENGERVPSREIIEKIANGLNLSPEYLVALAYVFKDGLGQYKPRKNDPAIFLTVLKDFMNEIMAQTEGNKIDIKSKM